MPFDPQYVANVLSENFKDAKALFLEPLVSIHYAHLVMLAERRIVTAADAKRLREALDTISISAVQETCFDGSSEDLFFHVERLLTIACGDEVAGRLHTARSRNDIDMTMYRMRQRRFIAEIVEAVIGLREVLLDVADRHRTTLFAALTHTQPAQPTTLAHYLLAVIEQLERDTGRLTSAYASTNRCPLGACAITGTGFDIDRRLTSDLLGFDQPTGNTYGSIATVDYLLESVSAAAILVNGLGRVLQDLLQWCSAENAYLKLADGFVQCSSIMPQKRNPVALEHARAIASKAQGQAQAVFLAVHNTPFGDIVDTEDDLQPLVASTFADVLRAVRLAAAAMRDARFDVERMEQLAAHGGTTLTELADHLVRAHGIPFRQAHAVTTKLLPALDHASVSGLSAILAEASKAVLGTALEYSDAQITDILSARHFVEVRKTEGGPSPVMTTAAVERSRGWLNDDQHWLLRSRQALEVAAARLRARSAVL